MEALSKAASEALGRTVVLTPSNVGGGASGGGGASTSTVTDGTNTYFCKAASDRDMLFAEYTAVRALADTQTIKVPTPIAYGEYKNRAFVLFEYLQFCAGGSQYELGRQLAALHRHTSPSGKFGFDIDNTIGATFQPNRWMDTWEDFWDDHRLGHMLRLTNDAGYSAEKIRALRSKTRELLSHQPQGTLGENVLYYYFAQPDATHRTGGRYTSTKKASLLHGDLWGGNKGFCKAGPGDDDSVVPCIFDPATYYGDREADVAMTYLFGGFTNEFYVGYESVWPLPDGHEKRRTVYNLYHILNHEVLFGGGYLSQARSMMEKILRS